MTTPIEFKDLLGLANRATAAQSMRQFLDALDEELPRLAACTRGSVTLSGKGLENIEYASGWNTSRDYLDRYTEYYYLINPFLKILCGRRARTSIITRTTDLIPEDQWGRYEIFVDFFWPHGTHYQVAQFLTLDLDLTGALVLSREKGAPNFTADDLTRLRAVGPFLENTINNLVAYERARSDLSVFGWMTEDPAAPARLIFTRSGELEFANRRGREALDEIGLEETRAFVGTASPWGRPDNFWSRESSRRDLETALSSAAGELRGRSGRVYRARILGLLREPLAPRELVALALDPQPDDALGEWLADFELTPRQAEVARRLCDGYGNEQIAAHLDISSNTVKRHVTAILAKSGARSRLTFMALFRERLKKRPGGA